MAGAAGFLALWPVYGELYRHGGDKAIKWTDLTARVGEPIFTRADTRVFESEVELRSFLSGSQSTVQVASASPMRYLLSTVGPRSSTGFRLRVLQATEERGRIIVRVREETPQLGETVVPQVTYPFLLLALPVSNKPVRVELEGRP